MTLVLVALIGLIGNCVVAGAFTYTGKQHAKERQFLINTALSNNTYEFAVRQSASQETKPAADADDAFDDLPDGLYGL